MVIPGLAIDPAGAVPVYRQIAEGIRVAAMDGRLAAGRRLPPTRDLARQLGVNRQTVVSAYDELAAEGWVRSHTGRGTFLTPPGSAAIELEGGRDGGEEFWLTAFSRTVESPNVSGLLKMYRQANAAGGISFAGSYPARELMPVVEFRAAMDVALGQEAEQLLVYGPAAGHLPLREWIAGQMMGDPRFDPARVLITNGAQQAIDLVFHTFLDRGDAVVIEEPTYTGALSVLGSLGARVVGVPVDDHGMRPDLLAAALERHRPRLIYVQPGCHNPTTAVMGPARRRELLGLAARYNCLIVEDDWASGLRYEPDDLTTLHALDGGRRVIYLNTFSKKLLPGLRVGWIAAPAPAVQRLVALKQIRDCGTSPLLQAALHRFLEGGGLERHLGRVLPEYRRRRDGMLRALERHMPPGVTWTCPSGGLFVWVALPEKVDEQDLFVAARQQGVFYSRGAVFHNNREGRGALRLTFSAVAPQRIEEGVAVLGNLIGKRRPDANGVSPPSAVDAVPIL